MATECAVRPKPDRRTGHVETEQVRWFDVDLSLHFFSPSTGAWGSGLTRRISRSAVVFVPSGLALRVGDVLQYVLVFPGSAGRPGAVGSCRGRVVRTDAVVTVTIDRYRLQTATAARTSRDARTRRLAGRPNRREQ
jgi:hypothetical protein